MRKTCLFAPLIYPFKVPTLLTRLYPGLEWHGAPKGNNIYLTFDDGPHPVHTPWVMQELENHQVKASFFCVGDNARKFPDLLAALRKAGHTVGNHTYNHLSGWATGSLEYLKNVHEAEQIIHGKLFRPPYGRVSRRQLALLKAAGFRVVMWSQLSCDYAKNLDREKSLQALIKNSKPGSIVVFHDSEKAASNLRWLLPRYLEEMKRRDYQFSPL